MSDLDGVGLTSARVRFKMVARLREQGITDERVLRAMEQVPRHIFVQEAFSSRAYDDTALPLGLGQTISQPWVVAKMLSVLLEGKNRLGKVLEIGTGCGYQTALLSLLAEEVFSVERLKEILNLARTHLQLLKMSHVRLKHADGFLGLKEAAPFDGIIVAAAMPELPVELLKQLKMGGRLVAPVALESAGQYLSRVDYSKNGFEETRLEAVRFVPLLSGIQ